MTEQDLIHKIEWVNKRCSLKGEPLTQSQIELLRFVFADIVVNKNFDLDDVSELLPSVPCECGNNLNLYLDGGSCWDCDTGNVY